MTVVGVAVRTRQGMTMDPLEFVGACPLPPLEFVGACERVHCHHLEFVGAQRVIIWRTRHLRDVTR